MSQEEFDKLVAQYHPGAEDVFKRNLRLKGFNDIEIQSIIEVTDDIPIFLFGTKNIEVDSKNGVITIFSTLD